MMFLRSLPDFFDLFNSGGNIEAPAPPPDKVGNVPDDVNSASAPALPYPVIVGSGAAAAGAAISPALPILIGIGVLSPATELGDATLEDPLSTVVQQSGEEDVAGFEESLKKPTSKEKEIAKQKKQDARRKTGREKLEDADAIRKGDPDPFQEAAKTRQKAKKRLRFDPF